MESAMSGLLCAINIDRKLKGKEVVLPPITTAIGSLIRYITSPNENFQPMHVSYSLMPELEERVKDKKKRKEEYSRRAISAIERFAKTIKE